MGKEVFVFPTSSAQQRLWFFDQLEPGNCVYNIPTALCLTGPLDVAALEQGINEIVQRHEILRTTFSVLEDRPVQVVAPTGTMTLPVVDLQKLSKSERETEAHRLTTEEIQEPFDLSRGPLLRARLLRLAEEEHILLLTLHHIVSDEWSMGILFRELSMLYEAFATGKPWSLPALPIQYADFAVWQREWLQGEILEAQLSYWREHLAGAPPMLKLNTDRPRPEVQTFRGARQTVVLSKTLSEAFKDLSQQEGTTLFMTVLAAFQVLLHRYTGQKEIVVGTPVANRNPTEIEELIGFFVNTLVLRTDLSGDPTFRELLRRVREVCVGAYACQDLPFDRLVEELQPERNLSHAPLFQVMFVFQNEPLVTPKLLELSVSSIQVETRTSKFELMLIMQEDETGLRTTIEYNTDLYDGATVKRMLAHLEVFMEGIIADADRCLAELPLLTEAERHRLLVAWNDRQADYPRDRCIHQLFEAWAEGTPEEVAVVFEGRHITYEELNARANQLAHCLREQGVGPEKAVGLCIDRSIETVVGMMGILKAGGAYVPLDSTYPQERLAFMLEDSRSTVLVTEETLKGGLPDVDIPVLCVDAVWGNGSQWSRENPERDVTSENMAYVMYTSGSTGRPKGVMISHRNVVGFLYGYKQVTLDGPRRVGTSVATFGFDTSVEEIYATLCFGGTLHIIRPENSTDVDYFARYLVEHQITTTYIVPDFLSGIAIHLKKMRDRIALQCIITGLAPKKERVLQSMRDVSERIRILNAYGPTEVTYGATAFDFHSATDQDRDAPIGVPFPNYEVYIVDSGLRQVPIGVTGEIVIGGVGLARGYLNRPELTAETFVPHPFRDEVGARLYRTGDQGRYLPDGTIEFLGRRDDQVKIRGFRIELGEIETVMGRHPAVEKAVVLTREDRPGDRRLVAYVVPKRGAALSVTTLRTFLSDRIPNYMMPSVFIFLEALPLLPSGKIDLQALPPPDQTRPEMGEAYVAPRTSTEEAVAGIWTDVLGVEHIGVHDNFFVLGGHSLLVTQVFSRVRAAFQVDLPLRRIFEASTVAQQARAIAERMMTEIQDLSEKKALELLRKDDS